MMKVSVTGGSDLKGDRGLTKVFNGHRAEVDFDGTLAVISPSGQVIRRYASSEWSKLEVENG